MKNPEPKGKPIWKHPILLGVWLLCSGICFAVLHMLTSLPIWVSVILAIPLGLGLFFLATRMAEV
jgi:membrane protease YdiL (CAAX protease family)